MFSVRIALLVAALAIPSTHAAEATDEARAARLFPLEKPGSEPVLAGEKVLRMPGTRRERAILPQGTRLQAPSAQIVRANGKPYRLVLWEAQRPEAADGGFLEDAAVLAVFPEGQFEATDVAEVKTDRLTFFGTPAIVPLGPDDAFTLVNHHANAGQPYTQTDLYFIRDGRLRRIASVSMLSDMAGCRRAFEETLHWRTEPDQGEHPKLVASVLLTHAPAESQKGCPGRPGAERQERFEATYRWDSAKGTYVGTGSDLDRLDRWNERRM